MKDVNPTTSAVEPETTPSEPPEPDTKTGIVTPDDIKRQIDKIPDAKPGGRPSRVTEETKPIPKEDPVVEDVSERPPAMVTAKSPRAQTATMVTEAPVLGEPPPMPGFVAPVDVSMGGIEDPTNLPGPREIPGGHPTDPAAAPGRVPRGDSRSFRRNQEFALVYRQATFVISRVGVVGTRGQWKVVEYPTSSSASHAYAKEASRFASEGFSDYRD